MLPGQGVNQTAAQLTRDQSDKVLVMCPEHQVSGGLPGVKGEKHTSILASALAPSSACIGENTAVSDALAGQCSGSYKPAQLLDAICCVKCL